MANNIFSITDEDKPLTATGVKNRMIARLLQEGTSSAPVQHWTQVASRVAQSLLGGYQLGEADKEEKANQALQTQTIAALLGSGGAPSTPAPTMDAPSMPPQAAPRPPASMPPPSPGNVAGPVPPDDPTMTISPRQVAQANAPQGVAPAVAGVTAGPRPPMGMHQPTPSPMPPAASGPMPGAAPPGPMPAASSAAPPDMQAKIAAMLHPSQPPAVQQMGKQLAAQVLAQRMKPPEYEIKIEGGVVTAVNKRDPRDRHVVNDPAAVQAFIDQEGRKTYATTSATERAKKDVAKPERDAQAARSGGIVVQDIDRALAGLDKPGLPTTGPVAALARNVPGTNAFNAEALISTIKSNVGFDRLQQMRESSPTGGALGAVTVPELQMLQSAIGNLDLAQDKAQFSDNLRRVKNIYMDIIHGKGNGPRETLAFENRQGGGQQGGQRPRARNPQTGAVVEFDGSQWVPAR